MVGQGRPNDGFGKGDLDFVLMAKCNFWCTVFAVGLFCVFHFFTLMSCDRKMAARGRGGSKVVTDFGRAPLEFKS